MVVMMVVIMCSLDSCSTTDVLGSSLDSNIMCRAWFKLGFELGFERHAWFELGLRCRKIHGWFWLLMGFELKV